MKEFLSWLSNFDSLKAIFLAIVAVLGSWYDLKGTVEVNRTVAKAEIEHLRSVQEAFKEKQDVIDTHQNQSIELLRQDIQDGFKDLKGELRASRTIK